MPEGPEIRRAADQLGKALGENRIDSVWFAFPHLAPLAKRFENQRVTAFETRGKALLTRFENGWNIYSHNQLYGKWKTAPRGALPKTSRQLRLALHSAKVSLLLYSASDIEVLDDAGLETHPFLRKLGPDVLSATPSIDALAARLSAPQFNRRSLAALLLDQAFVAGLGNYLRTEILFRARIHPLARPNELDTEQRHTLAREIIITTQQAYQHRSITNDLVRAKQLAKQGARFEAYRFCAFERDGQQCYDCASIIVRTDASARRIYHCPTCQPSDS